MKGAFEWPTGGLWEDATILIRSVPTSRILNGSVKAAYGQEIGSAPCPHAKDVTVEPFKDGTYAAELQKWTVPFAVIGSAEAGHATTGACAECVVDAMNSLIGG